MSEFEMRLRVCNGRKDGRSQVVYIEPFGEDYTLLAEESLEIVVTESGPTPSITLDESENATSVYFDTGHHFEVYQGGQPIKCGHNRGR